MYTTNKNTFGFCHPLKLTHYYIYSETSELGHVLPARPVLLLICRGAVISMARRTPLTFAQNCPQHNHMGPSEEQLPKN